MAERTRGAFLWTRILSTPFYVLFTLLPYILYKDIGASLLQVTSIIILKPAVSLIAPYWSVAIYKRPDRILSNLCWANVLKFLPFLFIPLIDSSEYFTLASMIYLILERGVIPAWMELLKLNISGSERVRVFAYSQALDYLGIAFFPLAFGWLLDLYPGSWRLFFLITAAIGMLSTLVLFRIPKCAADKLPSLLLWKETLIQPWKQSWELVRTRPDFARFQLGFMLGGGGLMVLQPALPVFFTDTLNLSYTELALALSFCKGIAYALTTPFWVRLFAKLDTFRFLTVVLFLCALFPLILLSTQYHLSFLWAAYLIYGVMQGGSELAWHLSCLSFSGESDSSPYSQTNVLAQGIRGAIIPYLGCCLCQLAGAHVTLLAGTLLCFVAITQTKQVKVLLTRN